MVILPRSIGTLSITSPPGFASRFFWYLMGKDPFPFDLLFWNADATRMPRRCTATTCATMYQKNLLAKPGGLVIDNVPIDLGKITIPIYLQAGKDTYSARQVGLQGDATSLRSGPLHAGGFRTHRGRRQSPTPRNTCTG